MLQSYRKPLHRARLQVIDFASARGFDEAQGSCRRDLLDHVILLNERHLKRLFSDCVSYYHEDRTHLGLGKGTPAGRTPVLPRGRVIALPRVGGLHHRYDRAA